MKASGDHAVVYSMTGFARVAGSAGNALTWTLTLKSVNHRYLDLHMRMPSGTEPLEMRLRRSLKERIVRGHVEVTLNLERSTGPGIAFDAGLLRGYIAAFRQAAEQNGLPDQIDLNAILRLPGIFAGENRPGEAEMRALEENVCTQLDALLDALNAMRAQEGRLLAVELSAGMQRLEQSVKEIAGLRQDVQRAYFERIAERVSGLLNGSADRDRILQEAALLAERSDVEEEVARLRIHIQHFHSLLEAGGEIGKKLDFLLQEMNREANTLLSKTGGIAGNGQRITELGLEMKSEIEKAREQVQNIE